MSWQIQAGDNSGSSWGEIPALLGEWRYVSVPPLWLIIKRLCWDKRVHRKLHPVPSSKAGYDNKVKLRLNYRESNQPIRLMCQDQRWRDMRVSHILSVSTPLPYVSPVERASQNQAPNETQERANSFMCSFQEVLEQNNRIPYGARLTKKPMPRVMPGILDVVTASWTVKSID